MKLALVISALAVALTGCGGGGGDSNTTISSSSLPNVSGYALASSETINLASGALVTSTLSRTLLSKISTVNVVTNGFVPSLVSGDFLGDGSKYVVVSGWYVGNLTPPPVKIYKFSAIGTAQDVTVDILGSEFSLSVNYPIVADFNKDGIDDIFFPGFTDGPGSGLAPSAVFISRKGQSHQRQDLTTDLISGHATVAADLDNDGDLDVISNEGDAWMNNGQGTFTYQKYSHWGASGVCAGDFNNTGRTQLVFTDSYDTIQDTYIFEVNTTYAQYNNLTKIATLPTPYFDKNSTTQEISHDVSCMVADFNNDGRPDIVVVSASNDPAILAGTSPPQSHVQVYLNQGNYVFVESQGLVGYNSGTLSSYTPRVMDFNNDGFPDIWLMDWNTTGVNSNQFWINNGTGVFTQSKSTESKSVLDEFKTLTNGDSGAYGIAIPVKINGKWNLVFTGSSGSQKYNIGYATTQWNF